MNTLNNKEIFAQNLSEYLKRAGKSQVDLASYCDVSKATVTEWIKGKKYPRIDKIEKMAEYFGCLKSDLIENKTKKLDTMTDAEFSENRKKLMKLIEDCPENKAARLLQVLKLFLDSDKSE